MTTNKKEQDAIQYLEGKGYGVHVRRQEKISKKEEETIKFLESLGHSIVRRKSSLNPNFVYLIKTISTNGKWSFQVRKSKPGDTSVLNEEQAKVDIRKLKWTKMRRNKWA